MADELLELAAIDGPRAERVARFVLQTSTDDREVVLAGRALGVVLRDRGRLSEAVTVLRSAARRASATVDNQLAADVRSSLGFTLAKAGQPAAGLRHLDAALTVEGDHQPMSRMRRALVRSVLGRTLDAHADIGAAVSAFAAAGDVAWQARALLNQGWIELQWGQVLEAREHTARACRLFRELGLDLERWYAEQSLGEIALAEGDLPTALGVFDRCATEFDRLRHARAALTSARCQALLVAGLNAEAVDVSQTALEATDLDLPDRAWLTLLCARAYTASGRVDEARTLADESRALCVRLRDPIGRALAELHVVQADLELNAPARPATVRRVATFLQSMGAPEAPLAMTLAAKASPRERAAHLSAAGAYRNHPAPLVRAAAWVALALAREDAGEDAALLRACGRGLDALDEHRRTLGSTELRALATSHGRELASIALRAAARDARSLLRWSERWRATSLAQPPVMAGGVVSAPLAALRDNGRRLAEARAAGDAVDVLTRDRRRLERELRAEHLRSGGSAALDHRFDPRRLVSEVGLDVLVELIDVDGELHVLVVHNGRVRRRIAGPTAAALELVPQAQFLLRRAAAGRPYRPGDLGARLEAAILGAAARLIPADGSIVMVPTGALHGLPWGLLPSLADRAFTVTPSAAQWLRARSRTPASDRRVLVAGPGLGTGGAEVPVLTSRYPSAELLDGPRATVEATMAALDGADLVHLATHGTFRADSPLFSALELADGPLTVYDLERLRSAPHRIVLSACESGVLAPVGAEELLGLASALFALGTSALVCSVAEVNDEATAELMVTLHAHLESGTPGEALLAVRRAAAGRPTHEATAAAFVALGA